MTKPKAPKRINLSKSKLFAVQLAKFSQLHGIDPVDVAELVTLAERAKLAGERDCNFATEATDKAYEKAHARFNEKAKALGFDVTWSGLWPTLTKNGQEIYLP